jgi:hypothetical protein
MKLSYPVKAEFPQTTPAPLLKKYALNIGEEFDALNVFSYVSKARHPRPRPWLPVGCVWTAVLFRVLKRKTYFPPCTQSFAVNILLNTLSSAKTNVLLPSDVLLEKAPSP